MSHILSNKNCQEKILLGLINSIAGWFGIRKNFCHFLLDVCPCFQEYCNISYSVQDDEDGGGGNSPRDRDNTDGGGSGSEFQPTSSKAVPAILISKINSKPVVPIVSIEMPD